MATTITNTPPGSVQLYTTDDTPAYVTGTINYGLQVAIPAPATVFNSGAIYGGDAIYFNASGGGGIVSNTPIGLIAGGIGIFATGGYVNVTNSGAITGTVGSAIGMRDGGGVTNVSGGTVASQGTGNGVYIGGAAGTVLNAGLIGAGSSSGILLAAGGVATNVAGGTITSTSDHAIAGEAYIAVSNAGLLTASGTLAVVAAPAGGDITNLGGGTISALLDGGIYIAADDGPAKELVTNAANALISGDIGVDLTGGAGGVVNAGTIIGLKKSAVDLFDGGTVSNAAGGTIASRGTLRGVYVGSAAGTISNAGLITASTGNGVFLAAGGYLTNAASGTLASTSGIALVADNDATVANAGLMTAAGTHASVAVNDGGTLTNSAAGTITAAAGNAVYLGGTAAAAVTLVNAGTVSGGSAASAGVSAAGNAYIANNGLISGAKFGVNASTTSDNSGTANPTLVNAATMTGGYAGAFLYAGGTITNKGGGLIEGTGTIGSSTTATSYGVKVTNAAGTVTNNGGIIGRNDGIVLADGGEVTNQSNGGIYIRGPVAPAGSADLLLGGTIASTVTNAGGVIGGIGTIPASGSSGFKGSNGAIGILASAGLDLDNQFDGVIGGVYGVKVTGGPVGITNAGTIRGNAPVNSALSTKPAVYIKGTSGGAAYLSNASNGVIYGYLGVRVIGVAATIVNAGKITGSGTYRSGIYLQAGGTITNLAGGIISAGLFANNGEHAVFASGSGPVSIVNAGTIANIAIPTGTIQNQPGGTLSGPVYIYSAGTVLNAGTILGEMTAGPGPGGVYISNAASGLISVPPGTGALAFLSSPATIVNAGTLLGGVGQASGVDTKFHLAVTNEASGTISNAIEGGYLTVDNDGLISGTLISHYGASSVTNNGRIDNIVVYAASTVRNAGTIGGVAGTPAFASYNGNALLAMYPGAIFQGAVNGGVHPGAAASTLELAAGTSDGTLSGLGSNYLNFGQIQVDIGATWTLTGVNVLSVGQVLTNLGSLKLTGANLTDPNPLVDDGVIKVDPSTFDVGGLTGTGTVEVGDGSTITINGTVSSGETIAFTGTNAVVNELDKAAFAGAITGEGPTDQLNISCFTAGTRIATQRGQIAIQALRAADRVATMHGTLVPIVWLGHRRVDCRCHPRRAEVLPVRIAAGAFGPAQPLRDLLLSPDHAVFAGGALIPIRYLVNGTTITQREANDVTYWHLELPAHAVLLAEGLPAESYLDTGNRAAFEDGPAATSGLRNAETHH